MKELLKRSITRIVTFVFLISIFPITVFAEDNEPVLTALKYSNTERVTVSNFSATIILPYNYSDSAIDLKSGLTVYYDESTYTSVSTSFSPDTNGIVSVGGSAAMTVNYKKVADIINGDASLAHNYTSTYTINVVKAAYVAPTFSGTISKTVTYPDKITFSASDFTSKYTSNDGGALRYISIEDNHSSFGSFQFTTGEAYNMGNKIGVSDLGKLIFKASAIGSFQSYNVTAYGDDGITPIGSVNLNISLTFSVSDIAYGTYDRMMTFNGSDFNYICTRTTGAKISYVQFFLPSSTYGSLYYNYKSSTSYESLVTTGTKYYVGFAPDISKISFVPYSTFAGTAIINYTAYNINGTSYNGAIRITLNGNAAPINYNINKDAKVIFSITDFNDASLKSTGKDISYVKFTLSSSLYGKLYYDYSSASSYGSVVSADNKYYKSSSPALSKITFVPKTGYVGTATINYSGCNTDGGTFNGTIAVTINDRSDTNMITYETDKDTKVTFSVSDFSKVCENATDKNLSYVKFAISSSVNGKLYYNYSSSTKFDSPVTASTKYYRSKSPLISKVSFVPTEDYSGTVMISYTGYNSDEETFKGTVRIKVGDTSEIQPITYKTDMETKVILNANDFNKVCNDATGENISYVKFTLPTSLYGKLYYNYTSSSKYDSEVSSDSKYYKSLSPSLSKITFVPKSSLTGTVTINYTGYNADGESFDGTAKITVGDTDIKTIGYKTDENTKITFSADDFNEVCNDATEENLSYVIFTLPSSSYGKLYYNYTSPSSYDSQVSADTKYYRSSSPNISNVTFVPKTNYSGKVTINYAGCNKDGDPFSGSVKITVGDTKDTDTITYTTTNDAKITFSVSDFNKICISATGKDISYVKFTLPSSSIGKLYYDYSSTSKYDSEVSENKKYNNSSSPYLSKVSFVPKERSSGTVTINYNGCNADGDSFEGTIKIEVRKSTASTIKYTTNQGEAISFSKSDFDEACREVTDESLSYVSFTLPSASMGKLYCDGNEVSSSTKYYAYSAPYLSKVTFVPSADYNEYVSIDYTGCSIGGASYTGKVVIAENKRNTRSQYFKDVDENFSWAVQAVDELYQSNVVNGNGNGQFNPAKNISRCDFVLMLSRALNLHTLNYVQNFSDIPEGSYYYDAVETAKSLGIAKGTGGRFYPEATLTREDAAALVARALQVSEISLDAGSNEDLNPFYDKDSISNYALDAVKMLAHGKVITGNGSYINPKGKITRAEMAVILGRVKKLQ